MAARSPLKAEVVGSSPITHENREQDAGSRACSRRPLVIAWREMRRRLLVGLALVTVLAPAVPSSWGPRRLDASWIEGASTFWTMIIAVYVLTVVERERDRREVAEKTRAYAQNVATYVRALDDEGTLDIMYVNNGNFPIFDVRALIQFRGDVARSRYIRIGSLPPTREPISLERVSGMLNDSLSRMRGSRVGMANAWLEPHSGPPQVVLDFRDHLGASWHRGTRGGPPERGFVDFDDQMWIMREDET